MLHSIYAGTPRLVILALSVLCLLCAGPVFAQLPQNFQIETIVAGGITAPTYLEFLPDGSMLITEFGGTIRMVPPGGTQVSSTPVLQIANMFQDTVNNGGERGLVGLTLDPNFSTNHYFYIFYTANSPQRDRVSRFTLNGVVADPASELVIWQGAADSSSTDHHGGCLAFGPDGKLYISTGDNGDPQSVQSLSSDHGKILRINADGTVPADNPFHDGNGPNIDSIWALGLRNPYRFSFDAPTGRMYIGDVGNTSVEEINLLGRGSNYGWPTCEGPCSVSGMTNPIYNYSHNGSDAAVTLGFVYRGSQFPSQYQGVLFYADYAKNRLAYLTLNASGQSTGTQAFLPNDGTLDGPYGDPVCLKQGPDGSLYYIDIGIGWPSGLHPPAINRIRYVSQNQPPVVVSSASPTSGLPPLTVAFSSAGSSDPEGGPLTFSWTFGDGDTSTAANPSHVYQNAGPYTARLTVSDGTNSTLGAPMSISVGRPPVPSISAPVSGGTFQAGDVISFSGTATDPDGTLSASAFTWSILFRHDTHIHPAGGPFTGVTSGTFTIPSSGHDFAGNTSYEIVLTVTDSTGLTASSSTTIYPQKVNITFSSVPTGLSLSVDGIPFTTPFVKDALVKFHYTIQAPNQSAGPNLYNFTSWSDGGAQTHDYTVPAVAQALAATFQATGVSNLTGAWTLDETSGPANDASGNNHVGTLVNNPTRTAAGKYSGALTLNGTSNYVRVDSPALPTGDFTWMLWINRANSQSFQTLMEAQGTTAAELEFNIENGKVLVWSSGAHRFTGTTTVPSGAWVHIALTRSNGVLRAYINGIADSVTGSDTRTFNFNTCPLLIGVDADSGCIGLLNSYLNATIDDVRIYSRALTQSEIQSAMNLPIAPPAPDVIPPARSNSQPSGTLPAGSTQATLSLATDESAICRYSLAAGTPFASMALAFSSSGGTSHSTVITGLSNGTSYTYYVKCQDGAGNSNSDDVAIAFTVAAPVLDTTPPLVSLSSPTNNQTVSGAVTVVATASDTNGVTRVEFFIDGVLFATDTSSPYSVSLDTLALANGSRALTAKAYDPAGNTGASSPVTITVSNTASTPVVSPNGGTFVGQVSVTLSTATIGASIRYTIDGSAPSATSPLYSAPFTLTANATVRTIALKSGLNNSGIAQAVFVITTSGPVPTDLVDGFSFNEGSGTQVRDITINANIGTLTGGVAWTTQGRYGKALSFGGVNGYVQVASPDLPTQNFTWEAWVKPSQMTSFQAIMMARDGVGPELNLDGNGRIVVYSSGVLRLTTALAVPVGTWTHIALTRSSSTLRVYINGVAAAQTGTDNKVYNFSTCPLLIGVDSDSGCTGNLNGYFTGLIDEVRIYKRALTQAEVQQDMASAIVP